MAKKSRRARRQEAEKQRRSAFDVATASSAESSSSVSAATSQAAAAPAAEPVIAEKSTINRKAVDFSQEYFYVYVDLRNILIIAVLMVAVLIGLSLVI